VKWELDGSVLHLYELDGGSESLRAAIAEAEAHGRSIGAALLYAELFEGDAVVVDLQQCGFERDAAEADVKDARVTRRLSFVKVL
jgi:hypothetical protein